MIKKKKKIKKPEFSPFKLLELQLKLQDIEKRWTEVKKSYDHNGTAKDVDEVLKLTVEKITVLAEMSYYTYEA